MSVNWMKLVAQGRAKAYGVSWTEEEAVAIAKCNEAEKVALIEKLRAGVVLAEALESAPAEEKAENVKSDDKKESSDKDSEKESEKKGEETPDLEKMTKKELLEVAAERGVEVPEGSTKQDILDLLAA